MGVRHDYSDGHPFKHNGHEFKGHGCGGHPMHTMSGSELSVAHDFSPSKHHGCHEGADPRDAGMAHGAMGKLGAHGLDESSSYEGGDSGSDE